MALAGQDTSSRECVRSFHRGPLFLKKMADAPLPAISVATGIGITYAWLDNHALANGLCLFSHVFPSLSLSWPQSRSRETPSEALFL